KYQGTDTGTDMDYVASGKVHGTDGGQEPSRTPDHVGHRVINKNGPQKDKEEQCLKTHTAHKGAGDQGRGDHGKHHLEHTKDQMWEGVRIRAGFHTHAV